MFFFFIFSFFGACHLIAADLYGRGMPFRSITNAPKGGLKKINWHMIIAAYWICLAVYNYLGEMG